MKSGKLVLVVCLACYSAGASANPQVPILMKAQLSTSNPSPTPTDPSTPGTKQAPNPPVYTEQCNALPAPGSISNASGQAILQYYPASKTLKYAISYGGLSGPAMMAHYHSSATADSAASGPIVQTICGLPPKHKNDSPLGQSGSQQLNGRVCPKQNHGFLSGEYVLKGNASLSPPITAEQEEKLLLNGQMFLNFHTCLNMGGEISGAIIPVTK